MIPAWSISINISFFVFILLFLSFISNSYASGTYAPRTRTSYARPRATPVADQYQSDQSISDQSQGYKKSIKSLKSHIYTIPRNKIAIHNIYLKGALYVIEGIFEDFEELKKFMKKLKRPKYLEKTINLKRKTKRFAGVKTHHFIITSENLW